MAPVIVLGNRQSSGVYLLRVRVGEALNVRCGRFRGGAPIELPPGDYVYVGSAMGRWGASNLVHRLLRHTVRSGGRPPQQIQTGLLAVVREERLGPPGIAPPGTKRLHWNIDYLLDEAAVALVQVYVLCSEHPLEAELAALLAAAPETSLPAPGFGAHDHRGQTHLLKVEATENWWLALEAQLQALLATQQRQPEEPT